MNRQRKILLSLVVCLFLALAYSWYGMPRQQRIEPGTQLTSQVATTGQRTRTIDSSHLLRVDLLEHNPQKYSNPQRDLFNFVSTPPPKPKPVVASKPVPVPVPVVDPVVVRQTEVRQALARFTFLGFLLKEQKRTVFLSQGETLFLVQEGERFGDNGRFKALSITPEKMMISQSGADGTIDIQLVEKEPLTPSFEPRDKPSVTSPPPTPVAKPSVTNLPVRQPVPGLRVRGNRGSRWLPPSAGVDAASPPVSDDDASFLSPESDDESLLAPSDNESSAFPD
jgi:hypothetical protein